MRRFASLLPFSALVLFACGPSTPDRTVECVDQAPPADGKALVRLGTGSKADAFQPLADNAVVTVDYGSQGGKHVWIATQSWAPKKSLLSYTIQLNAADGTLIAQTKGVAQTCGAGWVTTVNDRVVFEDKYWYGENPTGPLKLTVAESDGLGTTVGQELTVTLK